MPSSHLGRESNFYKRETNNLRSPYDFRSVMHYGNTAFTKNGEDTIQAIHDPDLRLGQVAEIKLYASFLGKTLLSSSQRR